MKKLKFKSSLKCNGCVNAIKPFMDSVEEISSWNVDLDSSEKIIEVNTNNQNISDLEEKLSKEITKIGYTIERI
jgi:copper chaperone